MRSFLGPRALKRWHNRAHCSRRKRAADIHFSALVLKRFFRDWHAVFTAAREVYLNAAGKAYSKDCTVSRSVLRQWHAGVVARHRKTLWIRNAERILTKRRGLLRWRSFCVERKGEVVAKSRALVDLFHFHRKRRVFSALRCFVSAKQCDYERKHTMRHYCRHRRLLSAFRSWAVATQLKSSRAVLYYARGSQSSTIDNS